MQRLNNARGAVLGIVVLLAVLATLAASAVMATGVSRMSTAQQAKDRVQARYAAEAGLVWAMQRLWADPTFFCGGTPDPSALGGLSVGVTVTECGAGNASKTHTVRAKVVY